MISHLEYFMSKYIAGPTSDSPEQWFMSDMNTLKYGVDSKHCTYFLTFDRDKETVALKNSDGNLIEKCDFSNVLPFLRDRKLLEGWRPVSYLSYTQEDYDKVGYKGTVR